MAAPAAMIGRSRELIGRDPEVKRLAALVDHLGDGGAAAQAVSAGSQLAGALSWVQRG